MKNILLCLLVSLAAAHLSAQPNEILRYEPTEVKVSGTIARQVFPGPPNYEDITNGDEPEPCWILNLKQPVDVAASQPPDIIDRAQKNVRVMHLAFHILNAKSYDDFRGLLGKPVVVTGQLFGAHTGHHHTDVLLNVRDITLEPTGTVQVPTPALTPAALKPETQKLYAWPADSVSFPGTDSNFSPNYHWQITCHSDPDPNDKGGYLHRLKINAFAEVTNKKPFYETGRYCEILWSKDSAIVAVTDWMGSSESDIFIIHPQNPERRQPLADIVPDITKSLTEEERNGHIYWQALEWENNTTLRIRIFGHSDDPPVHEFLYEFRVSLATRSSVLLRKENSKNCDAETQVWSGKTTSRIPVGN